MFRGCSCSDFKVKVSVGVPAGETGSTELFCPLKDCGLLQRAGLQFLLVLLCSKTKSPLCHKYMTNNHIQLAEREKEGHSVATARRRQKAPERVNPAL